MSLDEPDLEPAARRVMARLDELATISAADDNITRLHLTPEHRRANDLVGGWMNSAGMSTRVDQAGNLIGRYEGEEAGAPALMIGSHLDTVRNAGRYDGTLGVLLGIAVVEALAERGVRLPFALEIVGFADEEGVRFQAGLLGSKAMTGELEADSLGLVDDDGITLAAALRAFGLEPGELSQARRDAEDLLGYLEVHIEQGPVLQQEDVPVAVVTAIAGAVRRRVTVRGAAGHAGTVPMAGRQDALSGAAESVLALETACRAAVNVVGTVGELVVKNGAVNVIPGEVSFTVDLRSADDERRRRVEERFRQELAEICRRRGLDFDYEQTYEAPACVFDGPLSRLLGEVLVAQGLPDRRLPSGAGHDAMALADLTDTAMLFVRCRDGISHHPAESVAVGDVEQALAVALRTVTSLPWKKANS